MSQKQGDTTISPKQEAHDATGQAQPSSSHPKSPPAATKFESAAQPTDGGSGFTAAAGQQDAPDSPSKQPAAPSAGLSLDDLIHSNASGTPNEGGSASAISTKEQKVGAGEVDEEDKKPHNGTAESSVDKRAVEAITGATGSASASATIEGATNGPAAPAETEPATADEAKMSVDIPTLDEKEMLGDTEMEDPLVKNEDTTVEHKSEALGDGDTTAAQASEDSGDPVMQERSPSTLGKISSSPTRRGVRSPGRAKSVRGSGIATRSSARQTSSGQTQPDDEGTVDDGEGDVANGAKSEDAGPSTSKAKTHRGAAAKVTYGKPKGRQASVKAEQGSADVAESQEDEVSAAEPSGSSKSKVFPNAKQAAEKVKPTKRRRAQSDDDDVSAKKPHKQGEEDDNPEEEDAEDHEPDEDDNAAGPSTSAASSSSSKKPSKGSGKKTTTTGKKSWMDALPQPSAPQGKARTKVDEQDHLAVWLRVFKNFNEWTPAQGEAVNRYQWLERQFGITVKHKFGEGEHIRAAYTTFVKNVLAFVAAGCKGEIKTPGATTEHKKKIKWDRVVKVVFEKSKPAWQDLRVERQLGQQGNEQLRQATNGVLGKIVKALEGK